jgi:transglutaminase-like putative cysteine protease
VSGLLSDSIRVRVGADLTFESDAPTPMLVVVRPRKRHTHTLLDEWRGVEPSIRVEDYVDGFGNTVWRFVAPAGRFAIRYDALCETSSAPDPVLLDLPKPPVEDLPSDVLVYTLPSRHCQSDLLIADAWEMFGDVAGGWAQVQAVCDWIHENIRYGRGSTSATSALDVYRERRGVCRDFAHIGVALCRALNFAARYACGYLPDIGVEPDPAPMDFHAWFEVFIDGAWRTFDARHNRPRIGRVLSAVGRDAVDVAFATVYGGSALTRMRVRADQVTEDDSVDRSAVDE